jgi:hypothetical protein
MDILGVMPQDLRNPPQHGNVVTPRVAYFHRIHSIYFFDGANIES